MVVMTVVWLINCLIPAKKKEEEKDFDNINNISNIIDIDD